MLNIAVESVLQREGAAFSSGDYKEMHSVAGQLSKVFQCTAHDCYVQLQCSLTNNKGVVY